MPNTIFASVRCRDSRTLIRWYAEAFGFETHVVHEDDNGNVAHAELRYGDGLFMLGDWRGEDDPHRAPGQGWAYVVVEDLQDHHDRAIAAGAELVSPVSDEGYGTFYGVRDPEGNLWSFGTYAPEP